MRVSGPDLAPLIRAVCGALPPPRAVRLSRLRDDAGVFDEGVLTWMPGPRSYTGEDVAEVSCHGNPLLVERLLRAFQAQGARPAQAGEFTRRAFLNGRMDLTRAEAVLQAIAATSPAGLDVARAGLDGRVAARAEALRDALVDLAAELEAALDYPGEDLLVDSDAALAARLATVAESASAAVATFRAGQLAVEGAKVALVGPVNAGKSSVFNALLGRARALVSPHAGTTRDVVESALVLDAARVVLYDTAGEREGEVADPIEAAGLALAAAMVREADLVLLVLPGHAPLDALGAALLARTADRPRIVVVTHGDLPRRLDLPGDAGATAEIAIPTGAGVDALRAALPTALRGEDPGEVAAIVASQRQRDAYARLGAHASAAAAALVDGAGAAVAVERVYEALGALDALTGRDTREAVLDRLFARFCIGK